MPDNAPISFLDGLADYLGRDRQRFRKSGKPRNKTPKWLRDMLSDLEDTAASDDTLPDPPEAPTPEPDLNVETSSGEEKRLRKKRRGIMSALGAGETGGFRSRLGV